MRRFAIPEDVILGPAKDMRKKLMSDPDGWEIYYIEKVREKCGKDYAGVPTDDIRRQLVSIRKAGKLGRLRDYGHGQSKVDPKPKSEEYRRHMDSPQWKKYRSHIIAFWGGRCGICYAQDAAECHHRTYERFGHEGPTDCILLCKKCRKVANGRRDREQINCTALLS